MKFKDYLTPVNNKLLEINGNLDKFKLANNICILNSLDNYNIKD